MRLPSLKSLRTFQIAAQHLSFKRAGDELSITASAVSHQIRNLELFLGLRLFNRLTRSLELTEAGQNYSLFLEAMFSQLESETQQLSAEFGRKITRLCVPAFFAEEALLPKLTSFEAASEHTDIRVTTQSSAMNVVPPGADVTILLGNPKRPGLETRRLFERRIVVACSKSYLADNPIRNYDDLNGHTLLVHDESPEAWQTWAKTVGARTPVPKKLLRSDSMSAIARAASKGLGVGLVSWPLSKVWFEEESLVSVFDEDVATDRHFNVTIRVEDKQKIEVVRLRDWIVKEFQNMDEEYSSTEEKTAFVRGGGSR